MGRGARTRFTLADIELKFVEYVKDLVSNDKNDTLRYERHRKRINIFDINADGRIDYVQIDIDPYRIYRFRPLPLDTYTDVRLGPVDIIDSHSVGELKAIINHIDNVSRKREVKQQEKEMKDRDNKSRTLNEMFGNIPKKIMDRCKRSYE
jgi:hypothetical protein